MKSIHILFSAGLLALPSFAVAQDYAQGDGIVEHVIVTTTLHKTEAQTALPVTVLSGDNLREQATASIGDTLASEPGLANASFGPAVGQPVIRGQQGPRVMVLQNGMGSADASNASADHAVSVEPVLAESIEVVRGPATLLYGGGAIGGVVNVIDQRIPETVPDDLSGATEVRHGSVNDESTVVVRLDGGAGNMAFHLDSLSRQSKDIEIPGLASTEGHPEDTSDGFVANSDSDLEAFTLGASLIFENGFIGLAVNRKDLEYGVPVGGHGHAHDEEEAEHIRLDIEQTRYDLRGGYYGKGEMINAIRWTLSHSDYQHDEIEDGEAGTHFSNDSWEGRVELLHGIMKGWQGAVGFQFQDARFAAIGEEAFIPETDVTNYGLFLVESLETESAVYELGVRLDKNRLDVSSGRESFNSLSLSASSLWNISEQWSLGVALSSAERAPVAEELFSNSENVFPGYVVHGAAGVIEVGNPELDNEQSRNIDLTLNYLSEKMEGFLTVYYNDFQDYIYLANTNMDQDEVAIFQYQQEDALFVGVEFELEFALGSMAEGDVGLKLFGDAIHGKVDRTGFVPRMPPSRIGGRLGFERDAVTAYLSVLNAADQCDSGEFETATNGYTRWDAGVTYQFLQDSEREGQLFLRLKNITDEEIRSSVSFLRNHSPEPGRSVEAGVRFMF